MIYNLYIVKKFSLAFLIVFVISYLIIISNGVAPMIWLLEQNSVSLYNLLKLAVLFASQLFHIIFSLSYIFATLIVIFNLISSKELLSLKCRGVSNYLIAKPFILISVVCYIVSFSFNSYIKPEAHYLHADNLRNTTIEATKNLFASKKFFSLGKSLSIYIYNSNSITKKFENILMDFDGSVNQPKNILTFAKSASLNDETGRTYMKFEQGQQLILNKNNDYLIKFDEFIPDLDHTFKNLKTTKRTLASINTKKLLEYFFSDTTNKYSKIKVSEEFSERLISPLIFLANLGLVLILLSYNKIIFQAESLTRKMIIPILFTIIILLQFVFQIVIYTEISKLLQVLMFVGTLFFGFSYLLFNDNKTHLNKLKKSMSAEAYV